MTIGEGISRNQKLDKSENIERKIFHKDEYTNECT